MSIPSPLRTFMLALAVSIVAVALYLCVQGVFMLYEWYQVIQWIGEVSR